MTSSVLLYDGTLQGRQIGAFIMGGESFKIIRPGFSIQGERRSSWTQFVHEGIPVYEFKIKGDLTHAINMFETQWKSAGLDDRALLLKALKTCKDSRSRKFKDGVTGKTPAPALTREGRGSGKRYQK